VQLSNNSEQWLSIGSAHLKKPVKIVLEHQKLKYCFKQLDLLYLKVVDKPGWKTSAHGR
jgi:hypothetical protein